MIRKWVVLSGICNKRTREFVRGILIALFCIAVLGCVVVPKSQKHTLSCGLSTDKLTLRVVDIAKETNTYYSIGVLIATPIILPTTAMFSAIYVATHNTYTTVALEKIKCKSTN